MTDSEAGAQSAQLRAAVVVKPGEDACEVFERDRLLEVRYSTPFKPRADRVTPGQLVALASAADGSQVIVWRWFDAVVLGQMTGQVRLWEAAHGEVVAQPRHAEQRYRPGTRAYLSAGLPGADWWVSGAATGAADDVDVELDEVRRFYTEHDLWGRLL
jgi:hypothetical protein